MPSRTTRDKALEAGQEAPRWDDGGMNNESLEGALEVDGFEIIFR